jgi:hypothetical protein
MPAQIANSKLSASLDFMGPPPHAKSGPGETNRSLYPLCNYSELIKPEFPF